MPRDEIESRVNASAKDEDVKSGCEIDSRAGGISLMRCDGDGDGHGDVGRLRDNGRRFP
jgi:hypothetical protein